MVLLTIGLLLFIAAHLFGRLAPGLRARMGDPGKGLLTLVMLAGLALIVIGFRSAPLLPLYQPLPHVGYLNNLLMLLALVLFGASVLKGVLWTRIRHPQFLATILWATAHLLVNGDLASVLLFGSLGLWSLGSILLINAREGRWSPPPPGPLRRDLALLGIAVTLYGAITSTHIWLGHNPFLGSFG
jgi:uncharacterized membrane protein